MILKKLNNYINDIYKKYIKFSSTNKTSILATVYPFLNSIKSILERVFIIGLLSNTLNYTLMLVKPSLTLSVSGFLYNIVNVIYINLNFY